jgi:DNA-binding TFAR19-related protein (PDSD5 family)
MVLDRLINFIRGKAQLPTALQKALQQYGNEKIKNVIVCRAPVAAGVKMVMNLATQGELERKIKDLKYEDIYHLSMYLVLTDGTKFKIEKNERINFAVNPPEEKVDCDMVDSAVNIPFTVFIDKAIKRVGMRDFITYDARTLNCQNFLMNILISNGISSPTLKKFVLQDADELVFKDNPKLGKIARGLTDIAAKASEANEIYDEVKDSPLVKITKAYAEPFIGDALISATQKIGKSIDGLLGATHKASPVQKVMQLEQPAVNPENDIEKFENQNTEKVVT